jgi:hypothetical protein
MRLIVAFTLTVLVAPLATACMDKLLTGSMEAS